MKHRFQKLVAQDHVRENVGIVMYAEIARRIDDVIRGKAVKQRQSHRNEVEYQNTDHAGRDQNIADPRPAFQQTFLSERRLHRFHRP